MESRKTFRLVASGIHREGQNWDFCDKIPGGDVCIDVQLRGPKEGVEAVGEIVSLWLNAGPFAGSWVDSGTERNDEAH